MRCANNCKPAAETHCSARFGVWVSGIRIVIHAGCFFYGLEALTFFRVKNRFFHLGLERTRIRPDGKERTIHWSRRGFSQSRLRKKLVEFTLKFRDREDRMAWQYDWCWPAETQTGVVNTTAPRASLSEMQTHRGRCKILLSALHPYRQRWTVGASQAQKKMQRTMWTKPPETSAPRDVEG